METTVDTQDVLPSERIAKGILPKVLNSFDMVAIFVAIVLFVTNAPSIANTGGVAYIYWALGFVAFLIPGAIVTGQLGLMFPGEGSIYLWTHKALGSFMGFFAGFCAWWPGILSIIVAGVVVVTFIQHLGSLFNANLLTDPWQQGVVIMVVLALSLVLSLLRFRVTQNIISTVFVAYGGAILLIGIAALIWLFSGHASTTNLGTASSWSITFGSSGNFTTFGFVILALLGIEVPLNMGVEINNVRAITRYLLWGSIVVMAAYLIATFGVMVAVPLKDQPNPTALSEAVQIGFGGAGTVLSVIFDIIMIGVFLFNASVFNYSFGRLLFISGLDRRLPAVMSKVNTNKVPWVAVVVQTVIACLFVLAIFVIGPLFAANKGNLATLMYYIILASVTIIWTLSMMILFVDVIIMRYKYRDTFSRIQLAPNWIFYLCAVLGLLASFVGFYATFTAPWVPLIGEGGWVAWITAIAVISLLIGIVVFFIGQAVIKGDVQDEELIAKVTG